MWDELKRDEALRHFHRGIILERAHRLKEAVEEYRQAISYNPNLREAHDALGSYYHRNGLLAKAAEEFHTVANLDGDFLAYFNLGYVLVELGRYDEAIETFQQCLRLEPNDLATHYEIGYIRFMQNRFEEALYSLEFALRGFAEDWEVHNMRGACLLGLRRYEEALHSFGRALMLTNDPQIQATILDRVTTIERHREFRHLRSTKDQLYADEGIVCLGSSQDDGLSVNEVQDYHFTYPDIGTTLQRFLALIRSSSAKLNVIVALDKLSLPLALALSEQLDLPLRRFSELKGDDTPLLVLAVAREAEVLTLTMERAPCGTLMFCLGLNWLRHSRLLPEITGVVARGACSVPWEAELRRLRAEGAAADRITECLERAKNQVLAAVNDTPLDPNLPRQIRYYTRQHRRLSFPL